MNGTHGTFIQFWRSTWEQGQHQQQQLQKQQRYCSQGFQQGMGSKDFCYYFCKLKHFKKGKHFKLNSWLMFLVVDFFNTNLNNQKLDDSGEGRRKKTTRMAAATRQGQSEGRRRWDRALPSTRPPKGSRAAPLKSRLRQWKESWLGNEEKRYCCIPKCKL